MQRKPITDEHLDLILTEMFTRVGLDYVTLKAQGFLKQPEWYQQYHWSEPEQEDFAQWLADFLKRNKYCRGKYRRQDAGYHLAWKFLMDFGWTTVVRGEAKGNKDEEVEQ